MCRYCEKYMTDITELKPGDITIVQKARYIQVGSNKPSESVPMNFCPNCGEMLNKEGK